MQDILLLFHQTNDVLKKYFNHITVAALVIILPAHAQELTSNSEISFCKERLPLYHQNVAARFEKALQHTANLPLHTIRFNAPKFFRAVEPILASYQIPNDFKYLCIVESALEPTALSAKGAFGFWQFMPETARSMGLIVNEQIDQRQDLIASTTAACRYFRQLYKQLGSWTLVAAAYNIGPTKMREYAVINRRRNYYQWHLNAETRQYIFRVVAIKEMLNRPSVYQSVLEDGRGLYSFLKNQGSLLGLTVWPVSHKTLKSKKVWANAPPFFLSICQSMAGGFAHLVPLAYQRNAFKSNNKQVMMGDSEQKPETRTNVNDGADTAHLRLWWAALPFYTRRRNELHMLPPKLNLSIRKQILAA